LIYDVCCMIFYLFFIYYYFLNLRFFTFKCIPNKTYKYCICVGFLHICEANSPWTLIPEAKRCPESLQTDTEICKAPKQHLLWILQNGGDMKYFTSTCTPPSLVMMARDAFYICTSKCFEKTLLCIIKTGIILVSQHCGRTTISLTNSFDKKIEKHN